MSLLGVEMEKSLLNILVCPQTGAPVELSKKGDELICKASKLAYPIRDGIPVMLVDQARVLDDSDTEGENG